MKFISKPYIIEVVDGRDIDSIVGNLTEDQRTVLVVLARVPKSEKMNTFHIENLEKRKKCWEIDVKSVLKDLANLGLVCKDSRPGCWRTTPLGRKVEHKVAEEATAEFYGFSVERR